MRMFFFFFFQAEDGIRDKLVTGVQTCALPISPARSARCRSTLAKPRSSYGSRRSRANASSADTRPAATSSRSRCRRSLSIGAQPQQEIRRAGLEAGEVDGDVDVAELAEARHDALVAIVLPEPRHLVAPDLQSRQPVVVAHAELPEAERFEKRLGGVDLAI